MTSNKFNRFSSLSPFQIGFSSIFFFLMHIFFIGYYRDIAKCLCMSDSVGRRLVLNRFLVAKNYIKSVIYGAKRNSSFKYCWKSIHRKKCWHFSILFSFSFTFWLDVHQNRIEFIVGNWISDFIVFYSLHFLLFCCCCCHCYCYWRWWCCWPKHATSIVTNAVGDLS